jgi:hypothetical protein
MCGLPTWEVYVHDASCLTRGQSYARDAVGFTTGYAAPELLGSAFAPRRSVDCAWLTLSTLQARARGRLAGAWMHHDDGPVYAILSED